MLNPVGLLLNTKTGRYHPVLFRPAPMPGNADANMSVQRYRSAGHHTEGFATEDEAVDDMKQHDDWTIVPSVWTWDGESTPAMTEWFPNEP